MRDLVEIAIVILISIVVATLFFRIFPQLAKEKSTFREQPTQTDFVMFCQKLSAETTNPEWKYESCKSELMKTIKGKGVRML